MKYSYSKNGSAENFRSICELPSAFCWTKMGGESGEGLEKIIRRKDIERRANNGLFIWGIGNSLGNSINELSISKDDVSVVFSRMKAKTKAIDASPNSLILWLGYYAPDGSIRELPRYSLVTSRGDTEKGSSKVNHYALFCRSMSPLSLDVKCELDANALVNYSSGKRLGYSQVTAVVKKGANTEPGERKYEISAIAELYSPYFAKLACPVSVSPEEVERASRIASANSLSEWKLFMYELKNKMHEERSRRIPEKSEAISFQRAFSF